MKKGFALPLVFGLFSALFILGLSLWLYNKPSRPQFRDKVIIPENYSPPATIVPYRAKSINILFNLSDKFTVEKDEVAVTFNDPLKVPSTETCDQSFLVPGGNNPIICVHDRQNMRTFAILENGDLTGYFAEERNFNREVEIAGFKTTIEYYSEGALPNGPKNLPPDSDPGSLSPTGKPTFFAAWIEFEGKRMIFYGSWKSGDQEADEILNDMLLSVNFYK